MAEPSGTTQQQPAAAEAAPPLMRRMERHVTRRLVAGFLVFVPIIVIFIILRIIYAYVEGFFRPLVEDYAWDFPGIGVLIALLILYVSGVLLAGKRVRALEQTLLSKIPIVGSIYTVSRQSIDALSTSAGHRFSRVVFVEWPRPGVRALGFVTGHIHPGIDDSPSTVVVYIPTVPNPTSGMLAWVPEKDVIATDISVEDAMKVVFSGGMVLPEIGSNRGTPAVMHIEEEAGVREARQG